MSFNAVVKRDSTAGGLELGEYDLPSELGPREVLVEVAAAGICGTDLTIFNWPPWLSDRMGSRLPVVIGHEFSGHVRKVGSQVADLELGQLVAVESHSCCGQCRTCLIGRGNVCEQLEYVGLDINGGFAEYVVLPAQVIKPVPNEIGPDSAALLEPFGLAVRSVLADGGVKGKSVLVTGLGPLGLMTCAAANACGAEHVIGIESAEYRLELARNYLGNRASVVVLATEDAQDGRRVRELAGPGGVDVWLDYSGAESALELGVRALAVGGEARLVGAPQGPVRLDLSTALLKEINFRLFHGRDLDSSWPAAISLLAEKRVDLAPLITHRVPLRDYSRAFDLLRNRQACKVLIDVKS
ncbi:MAG TPA: alcohol dehydrogenase catalytic domain-containing protein [Mycobacterium sp.]|jgi:threonine 3-dehydrogenase|nr:alcohol dehydrogenase catalytic domain-containing protein [Mycobacterium sp.]